MLAQSTLAKKTKAEILEEYAKMVDRLEEIKMDAQVVHSPASGEMLSKVQAETVGVFSEGAAQLQTTCHQAIAAFQNSIHEHLTSLVNDIAERVKEFDELQKAIQISKKTLETHYHIEVAAETIQRLVNEYEAKKQQLQKEHVDQRRTFEEEIGAKKREWERSQEEYAYATKRDRERDEEVFAAERARTERVLQEREAAIASREQGLQRLQVEVDAIPARLQQVEEQKERETRAVLDAQWQQRVDASHREWESEKRVLELRIETFVQQLKQYQSDIAVLRKEEELASKKAQELAIKVIESGAGGQGVRQEKDESAASVDGRPQSTTMPFGQR